MRVLLIEDDPATARSIEMMLKSAIEGVGDKGEKTFIYPSEIELPQLEDKNEQIEADLWLMLL